MTRYLIAIAVLAVAVGVSGELQTTDFVVPENPLAGDDFLHEDPAEGAKKAVGDDLLLSIEDSTVAKSKAQWGRRRRKKGSWVDSATKAVTKTATDTAKTVTKVAETAAEATKKTWDDSVKTIKDSKQYKAASNWGKKAVDSTGKFTSSAWNDVEDAANDVADHVTEFANSIANWFTSFQCDLNSSTMNDFINSAFSANPSQLKKLTSMGSDASSIKDGANTVAAAACTAIWAVAEATNPIAAVFTGIITTFKNKCPAIAGGNAPALSLGITLDASAAAGVQSAGAGAELGIAIDSTGEKYCYVGVCVSRGITVPPVAEAGTDVGIALSLWENAGCIPGESQAATLGFDVSIPVAAGSLGVSVDLTYVFESDNIANFYGVTVGGTGSVGTVTIPASASVSMGFCWAWCIGIDGQSC